MPPTTYFSCCVAFQRQLSQPKIENVKKRFFRKTTNHRGASHSRLQIQTIPNSVNASNDLKHMAPKWKKIWMKKNRENTKTRTLCASSSCNLWFTYCILRGADSKNRHSIAAVLVVKTTNSMYRWKLWVVEAFVAIADVVELKLKRRLAVFVSSEISSTNS